jgi:acyl-CoA synthetase (AMP-forming)/AMP-acid ligase II
VRAAKQHTGRGIIRGDRVAVLAPNSDESVLLYFALAHLGAILVPINPEFGAAEVAYVLDHAGVSAVACTPDALPTAWAACAGLARQPWHMLLGGSGLAAPAFRSAGIRLL